MLKPFLDWDKSQLFDSIRAVPAVKGCRGCLFQGNSMYLVPIGDCGCPNDYGFSSCRQSKTIFVNTELAVICGE